MQLKRMADRSKAIPGKARFIFAPYSRLQITFTGLGLGWVGSFTATLCFRFWARFHTTMLIHSCQSLNKHMHRTGVKYFVRTLMSQHNVSISQRYFLQRSQCLRQWNKLKWFFPARSIKMFAPQTRPQPKHKQDNVSDSYPLIYHNRMWRYYEYLYPLAFALATPIVIADLMLAYQYFFLNLEASNPDFQKFYTLENPEIFISVASVFALALFYSTLRIAKLYIPRIYYNHEKDHYIGIIQRGLFGKVQLPFTIKDVKPIKQSTLPILIRGNVSIKGRSFLVNGQDFVELSYYNRLMGHTLDTPFENEMPRDDIIKMMKSQRDKANTSNKVQRKQ